MSASTPSGRLDTLAGLRLSLDEATIVGGQAALPAFRPAPTGFGLRGTGVAALDPARWVALVRRGLGWARHVVVPAVTLSLLLAVLVASVAAASWLTQPRRPYAFYRSDSPLLLAGLGSGLTEAFPLSGGEQRVTWSAITEWGCHFEAALIPAGGGAPIAIADAPVFTMATGEADLGVLAPGDYAVQADSACAWTVTFGAG